MKLLIKKIFRINGLFNRNADVYFLFEENIL